MVLYRNIRNYYKNGYTSQYCNIFMDFEVKNHTHSYQLSKCSIPNYTYFTNLLKICIDSTIDILPMELAREKGKVFSTNLHFLHRSNFYIHLFDAKSRKFYFCEIVMFRDNHSNSKLRMTHSITNGEF